jgi:arabinofuranosyltransferase
VYVVNAWICDDAYITYRTIQNWVAGHGLRWNVSERVQPYTHPLWMLLMTAAYGLTREMYLSAIVLCFALLVGTVLVLRRAVRGDGTWRWLLLVLLLIASKAFIDYASSGLENALSYLLLALFFTAFLAPNPVRSDRAILLLVLCSALAFVNRQDTLLFYVPALVHLVFENRRRGWRRLLALAGIGMLPAIAWELFALVYYGFPFPNSAYAKLSSGIPASALIRQGLYYFRDSVARDPLTLLVCAASVVLVMLRGGTRSRAAAAGILLYFLYVLWIGGDFMSGRFFAVPFLLAAILLLLGERPLPRKAAVAVAALAILLMLVHPGAPIRSGPGTVNPGIDDHGIADERPYYFRQTGLIFYRPGAVWPAHDYYLRGLRFRAMEGDVTIKDAVGFYGFAAGPQKTIIDPYGITDPLLARLPAEDPLRWRIGHFRRALPRGYLESHLAEANMIGDPVIRDYYDRVRRVTRDPLFSRRRFADIWALNSGRLDARLRQAAEASAP